MTAWLVKTEPGEYSWDDLQRDKRTHWDGVTNAMAQLNMRAMQEGVVTATALPIHTGRTTQVWEVRIADERGRLVCMSRCTLAIVPRRESI